mmetsp:Transcript_70076/g.216719  ORF Transcript_70076/g.216719 Transcript_70076/m.216719 type:complete len:225 (+) Transcript_70076:149-823(+)
MRARWEKDEEGWHRLPPRAWPPRQPKANEAPDIEAEFRAARCPPAGSSMSPACAKLAFDLASARVFGGADPSQGLADYLGMAEAGSADAMVATGVCLLEGLGGRRDGEEALRWLWLASAEGSAQAHFELATLLLTGSAGLEEDEPAAFALFEKAAMQQHASGMFMVADCLLEGVGCQPDAARAVPLLLAAAEQGHRGARQHLRQLLDGKWLGFDGAAGPVRLEL